ncbi:chlorophyllide reductase [Devosia sp. LjRoot16]|uniref:chlorophyllide reductase n=1 Tax=Devosia sp. LjRoot16 TaxID=3342271 RepID=UPI003ECDA3BF
MPRIRLSLLALLLVAVTAPAIAATSSTSKGQISVAQVMQMLDRAGSDQHAGQLLQAYLGGVGESAGVLLNATDAKGKPYVSCSKPMALNAGLVRDVLANGAPNAKSWGETAATPLLVNALVSMADCR